MKILLLGANGQVGWELNRCLGPLGELVTTARGAGGNLQLDTGDLESLRATLDAVEPDLVVNATAYTTVDRAESEPERAMLLNAEVPRAIGGWAAANGAMVVHYSTDYVFDGRKDGPYVESDPTSPLNQYGRSKLAGDEALLGSGCAALILRVSWVYSLRGNNFLLTMRRLMQERPALRVVADQVGAPTWARSIAQATALALARSGSDKKEMRSRCGLYHLAPAGETSWHGFASAIARLTGADCAIEPIPASEYPTAAARPANSRLDSRAFNAMFGLHLSDWERDLGLCLV
jgi:dTDP-4-dehydrorhamnose reductase